MIRYTLLALIAFTLTSCYTMIDTTAAPPPVAVQKGDLNIDAGVVQAPVSASGLGFSSDAFIAGQLGIGFAITDRDHVYINGILAETNNDNYYLTTTARYLRKLGSTGSFEHFIGGQFQSFLMVGESAESVYSNGAAFQYLGRYNSTGGLQPYWSTSLGYGVSHSEIDAGVGSLALGIQYRIIDYLELRLEMTQTIAYSESIDFSENMGGFSLQLRYIF